MKLTQTATAINQLTQKRRRPKRFRSFDALRAIAALALLLHHAYLAWTYWLPMPGFMTDSDGLSPVGWVVNNLFRNLNVGVDLFFLISGFLITHLLLKEKLRIGRIDKSRFYVRRALRILPAYFLVLLAVPFISSYIGVDTPDRKLEFLFVQNLSLTREHSYSMDHLWSLAVEVQFYLLWPLILSVIPTRMLRAVFLIIIGASVSFRIAAGLFMEDPSWVQYVHTFSRIDVLVIGSWMALGLRRLSSRRWHKRTTPLSIATLFIAACLLVAYPAEGSMLGLKKYLFILPIAHLMLTIEFSLMKPGKTYGLLSSLGKVSYGIYLYSFPLSYMLLTWMGRNGHLGWGPVVYFILLSVGSIGLAYLSYYAFETHFLKLKDKFGKPKIKSTSGT